MGASDLTPAIELSVGRWGNSLAVRLPAELARQLGVGEGDVLRLQEDDAGMWQLRAKSARQRMTQQELMEVMRKHLESMPATPSVIREMRDHARY